VNTAYVQSLNENVNLLQLSQSMNDKYMQAIEEKLGLLHKYIIMSGDRVTSLAVKYETLENRMNMFESKYIYFSLDLSFNNFSLVNNI